MKTALLEIGVETLPARFIRPTLRQMEALAVEMLKAERLEHGAVRAVGSPMRLALLISGVAEKSSADEREASGPPARLLKDEKGAYTPQALGFARAQGVRVEDLSTKETPKGLVLLARKTLPGEGALQVLRRVFPALIGRLEFPKTLEWEESRFRFGRPIRNLVALYGKKVVPFTLAGVRAGSRTRGLAALGQKPVPVADPDKYVKTLRDRCVLVDQDERMKALREGLEAAAKRSGGRLDEDDELLEQLNFLCEHPVAVLAGFDKAYLELPQALLTTVLKTQLKFFPLVGKDGRLLPEFIGVRDGVSEGQKEVQYGFERVLTARYSDARFFFGRDRETTLSAKRAKLKLVGFQKGLGTMLDKSDRTLALTRWLCERLRQEKHLDERSAEAIADLCHCDLVSDVVKEFPELQGTMGGVYARHEDLGERVALGLEEFYFPVGAKGRLPSHLEAVLASLAGKVDAVAAMFSAGMKPTGSEDPFALRRLGNGAVRILLEKQVRVPLREILEAALAVVEKQELPASRLKDGKAETLRELEEFFWQRAESLFLDQGFRQDELKAVKDGGLDDFPRTYKRLAALHALRAEAEFSALAQAFKRASHIVKGDDGASLQDVDKALFSEEAERGLYDALARVEGEVRSKTAEEEYEAALRALVRIKPDLDLFFEKVLVMAQDPKVKANRLSLVGRLVRLFRSVADVSQIQN
ncbi:MAG: glycine--tRNA ligase subunit beta [Elusimicrobiota bacterium]|jgi:glycyl-tRNA synthetase beta chain